MSRLIWLAGASVLLLLIVSLFAAPSSAHKTSAYSQEETTGETYPNWMTSLPDALLLSHLSIPGTHDSGTYLLDLSVANLVIKTQTMSLNKQLYAGIRVWDIRLGRYPSESPICSGTELYIFHGPICELLEFDDDVLKTAAEFLDIHPGETVLMRVKEEFGDFTNAQFAAAVQEDLNDYASYIYTGESDNPTLGEMRGKIVILQNYTGPDIGVQWGPLDIQDNYELSSIKALATKWHDVRDQLDDANTGSMDQTYVNFLSGSSSTNVVFPYFVASGHIGWGTSAARLATGWLRGDLAIPNVDRCSDFELCIDEYPSVECDDIVTHTCTVAYEGVNIMANDYIRNNIDRRTGIVMADFPGAGLISGIIALNPWNNPPVASLDSPHIGDEGSSIFFDGSLSSDPDGDKLKFRWDFDNDGTWDTMWSPLQYAVNTWWDDYSGIVIMEVTDGNWNIQASTSVKVFNVDPTITNASMTVGKAFEVNVKLAATDPANTNPDAAVLDPLSTQLDCDGVEGYEVGPVGGLGATCSLPLKAGSHTVGVVVLDDDAGQSTRIELQYVIEPTYLCANRWTGDLRMQGDRCFSTEKLISLPDDGWITICANRWTADGRYSNYERCHSTETRYEAIGDGYLPVCVNRWDGSLRVTDRCRATERSEQS